jgi:arginyl-tRNA--protein-N-Asp/Glu arginylyltransferase
LRFTTRNKPKKEYKRQFKPLQLKENELWKSSTEKEPSIKPSTAWT